MTVSLRIVGNFYSLDGIPHFDGMTVKDVLDFAVANDQSRIFRYISGQSTPTAIPDGKPSVTAFFAKYPEPVTSQVSGIEYASGEYFLSESLVTGGSYAVWQYYVFTDKPENGGAYVPRIPPIQSFADALVPDGGSVVWRLVTILTGESKAPTVYRRAFGLDDAASV